MKSININNKQTIAIIIVITVFVLVVPGFIGWIYKNNQQSKLEDYLTASGAITTIQRTVVPDPVPSGSEKIFPYEVSKYKQNGYGNWHYGSGINFVKRLDIMPTTYSGALATKTAKLLNFFAMTDIHITDEESPAQAVYYGSKWGVILGYTPTVLYTTQVLDAAVQTINALHKQNPFNFGIFLGDDINNAQYNELRWFIDVLDGKNISPDSGVKDDPIPGPNNDYQDEFKAAGLDKTIPWYQVLGNHDHFWMGVFPPDDYIKSTFTGNTILNLSNIYTDPAGIKSRGYYMGAIDGRTPYGDIIGAGPVADFKTPPTVPADPDRRFLSRNDWISEFFNTSSSPKGHGFSQADVADGFANYSFEPKSDLPIKVIVLDNTQRDENSSDDGGNERGSLDKERHDWLVKELDKGQTEGKLMIVAAHIPIGEGLISKLHTYPNLILWIAGHRHLNTITALKSPDDAHPELGFWEVETASLRVFPQQFRTFQIVRNSDNAISIITTNVDLAVQDGSPAAISRSYAIAAMQLFNVTPNPAPTGSYNAELVKQLSPEMQAKLQD